MQASIIVPVWNGADVLPGCLDSIQEQAGDQLLEIICVDNDSEDTSAALIAERYPQARLLRQPVNLGFAGGVNVGIEAAQGNVLVLVNQDCIVQPGWLEALNRALAAHPTLGVAGCSISKPDGTIDHLGATIRRPEAYGVHLAHVSGEELEDADFVTGAAMAIPRPVVEEVGLFDEGFYPGYYEDADYCFRARWRGFAIACVASAHVIHLASSHAWQADTVRHHANHCLARYRFVVKHSDSQETTAFFAAELQAVEAEEYLDRAIGRAVAARDLLRQLPDVLHRRQMDLDQAPSRAHHRQFQVGFAQVLRQGYAAAARLTHVGLIQGSLEEAAAHKRRLQEALKALLPADLAALELQEAAYQEELLQLEQQEQQLLRRLCPQGSSTIGSQTMWQQLGLWLRSSWFSLTGRNKELQRKLQAIRDARMERTRQQERQFRTQLFEAYQTHLELCRYDQERLERRLKLLETLTDYEYR